MARFIPGKIPPIRKYKWILIVVAIVLALPASYLAYMEEQGNFHVITAGEAYRSAQLDKDELERYVRKYHIRSVLNLLGKRSSDHHYRDEIEVCRKYKIVHYNLHLSADKYPSTEQMAGLMEIFALAPRPILIHCKAGADRSGLVAAMWKVLVDKEPKPKASKQLSIRFGHVPFGPTTALDKFFEQWDPEVRTNQDF